MIHGLENSVGIGCGNEGGQKRAKEGNWENCNRITMFKKEKRTKTYRHRQQYGDYQRKMGVRAVRRG